MDNNSFSGKVYDDNRHKSGAPNFHHDYHRARTTLNFRAILGSRLILLRDSGVMPVETTRVREQGNEGKGGGVRMQSCSLVRDIPAGCNELYGSAVKVPVSLLSRAGSRISPCFLRRKPERGGERERERPA